MDCCRGVGSWTVGFSSSKLASMGNWSLPTDRIYLTVWPIRRM